MKKKEFKVLLMDFNRKKYEAYDVLPYFRNIWRGHRFNWDKDYNKIPVKTKEQLKEWIIDWARYQFWARCIKTPMGQGIKKPGFITSI